ncbi:hypothetical protein L0337_24605 [candidate division KSB1 bacterium]|nr:hypothetical protein [candidate division KSB1 bacterium]
MGARILQILKLPLPKSNFTRHINTAKRFRTLLASSGGKAERAGWRSLARFDVAFGCYGRMKLAIKGKVI